jgi:hypothetical protein
VPLTPDFGKSSTAMSQPNLVTTPEDVAAESSFAVSLNTQDRQNIYYDKS